MYIDKNGKRHIEINDRFGKLTVIDKADDYIVPSTGYSLKKWKCICDCGKETIVFGTHLLSGYTKSCRHCNDIQIGDKFGRLTIICKSNNDYIDPKYGRHFPRWYCICDCGKEIDVRDDMLKSKKARSCGCLNRDIAKVVNTKHELCNTRIYSEYSNMRQRCCNINNPEYKNYGGRGIKICSEWLDKENGFINFYNWSISNGYKDNLSIDRINVDGNYEPSNCRWIPKKYQAYNKKDTIKIFFNGEYYALPQIADILGIKYSLLKSRLKSNNWNLSSIFTYITNEYGFTRAYLLDRYGNPIPINAIYFIDEYGFPISQDQIE